MTTYTVTLTVELDFPIDDATARDLVARWAAALRLDPRLTSVDGEWLTVHARVHDVNAAMLAAEAVTGLHDALTEAGRQIATWHAVEVVSAAEHARRDAAASLSEVLSRSAASGEPTP